ncbi:hypothetical protein GF362_05370 [Candidatus Dojkabacteria bacterium]|nr:hypothetical protein [Candidatus Dojkabacteria bacterium]
MIKRSTRYIITIFTICIFYLFLLITKTYALPIGPDKYYIDGILGETVEKELTIYGKQDLDQEQKLYISAVGMEKIGEEHERTFYYPDPNDMSEPANWITINKTEGIIRPGDTIVVPWRITIPESVGECGTSLAAIMVSNKPTEDQQKTSKIDVAKEIISQIHINLPSQEGENCEEILSVFDFYVNKKSILGFKIFNYDNVPFVTKLENNGKKLVKAPKGYIEIFGIGDRESVPFNDAELDVYPESTRKFENTWLDEEYPHDGNFFNKLGYELTHLKIGRYKARLGITKNVETQIIAHDTFWIIPWRIVLFILFVFAGGYGISKIANKKKESKLKKKIKEEIKAKKK